MSDKQRWKTVMKYLIGMVVLALSIDLALLLPEWYGSWQDSQVMGKTQLSSRENIEFLDTVSLDMAGRMKMLSEVTDELFYQESWNMSLELGSEEEREAHGNQFLERFRTEVDRWIDCGILPGDCAKLAAQTEGLTYFGSPYIYTEQNAFQVDILRFTDEQVKNSMTLILDSENAMMYYASFSGEIGADGLAGILGFASFTELLEKALQEGEDTLDPSLAEIKQDFSQYDFAAVCGAQEAEASAGQTALELDIQLKYENFDGYAYRRTIINDMTGFGIAVMYGTQEWQNILANITTAMGYYEEAYAAGELFGYVDAAAASERDYGASNESYGDDKNSKNYK